MTIQNQSLRERNESVLGYPVYSVEDYVSVYQKLSGNNIHPKTHAANMAWLLALEKEGDKPGGVFQKNSSGMLKVPKLMRIRTASGKSSFKLVHDLLNFE